MENRRPIEIIMQIEEISDISKWLPTNLFQFHCINWQGSSKRLTALWKTLTGIHFLFDYSEISEQLISWKCNILHERLHLCACYKSVEINYAATQLHHSVSKSAASFVSQAVRRRSGLLNCLMKHRARLILTNAVRKLQFWQLSRLHCYLELLQIKK